MNYTRAEIAELERRRDGQATCPVKEGWRDGALTVFVAGRPRNPLNGDYVHWSKHRHWAKTWRERTATRLFRQMTQVIEGGRWRRSEWPWKPETPKVITFTVYGPSRFDPTNLPAVCKPVLDGVVDARVVHGDSWVVMGDAPGHRAEFAQAKPSRKKDSVYGIAVQVGLA